MSMLPKKTIRNVKNIALNYSDIQIKVREATSNDPSLPNQRILQELSDATFNQRDFLEIMEMLDKRLNDSGKNWRHVYKALIVLEFLIPHGSEAVISYAVENLYVIKTLKEFQYIDDDGRDQGANVRQKSREVTSLLAKDNRYQGSTRPSQVVGDDDELKRALEESKRTAMKEEQRRNQSLQEERDLKLALELSEEEARKSKAKSEPDQIDFFSPIANDYVPAVNLMNQFGYDPFAQDYNRQQMLQQQMLQQQLEQQRQQQLEQQRQQLMQQQLMQKEQWQRQMAIQATGSSVSSQNNPFSSAAVSKRNPFAPIPNKTTGDFPAARNNVSTIDPFASISSSRTAGSLSHPNPFGVNPDHPAEAPRNISPPLNSSNSFVMEDTKNPFHRPPGNVNQMHTKQNNNQNLFF